MCNVLCAESSVQLAHQSAVCIVQCAVGTMQCPLSSGKYAVPELPAGVGVQGLLVEVWVDLAGNLDPLHILLLLAEEEV